MPKFVKSQEDAVGFLNIQRRRKKTIQTLRRFSMSDEQLRGNLVPQTCEWFVLSSCVCVGPGIDSCGLGGLETKGDVGPAVVTLSGSADLDLLY